LADGLDGDKASNYSLPSLSSYHKDNNTVTITPKELAISDLSVVTKTYNGKLGATLNGNVTLSGLLGDDTVTINKTDMIGLFDDTNSDGKDVGTGKVVNVSGITLSGAQSGNYSVGQQATLTGDIERKTLTVSGLTASNKEYDGNKFAVIDTANLERDGLVVGDDVTMDSDTTKTFGTFGDANVGENKSITLTSAYLGADVGNYTITDQATINVADIAAKVLTAVFKAADKVYDGMKTANATLFSISGMVGAETLTVSNVGSTFSDKNVDDDKTVTINSYTLVNGDNEGLASNYSLAMEDIQTANANITAKDVTASGLTRDDKTYDGTLGAGTITGQILTG
jgi:hypothetical protein